MTLHGVATRRINGSDVATKSPASIPAGTEVTVRERWSGWEVSASGVRTLPMTWAQVSARVSPDA